MEEHNNPSLIRRRFYLSKESLNYLDVLALEHKVSPSILLDTILLQMVQKKQDKQ